MAKASSTGGPNASEAAYWVSPTGQKWVAFQQSLDRLFSDVTRVLMCKAAPSPGEAVLDLGCGTGATILALSSLVGSDGHVVAVDISPLLLNTARDRAQAAGLTNVCFVEADAQTYAFQPASVDLLVSRFGSMFFSDPVAAFENLRSALRPGGRVCLAGWASVAENPWFAMSSEPAMARLDALPKPPANSPGPFAFADRDYAAGILRDAGFFGVTAEAMPVSLVAPDSLTEAAALACNVGQAARIIAVKNGTAEDAAAIVEAVAANLSVYETAAGIHVPAVINLYSARRP